MTIQTTREYFPDLLALRSFDDMLTYEDATTAFAQGGNRSDLVASLFGLGLTAAEIKWHAEYPGRELPTAVCELD